MEQRIAWTDPLLLRGRGGVGEQRDPHVVSRVEVPSRGVLDAGALSFWYSVGRLKNSMTSSDSSYRSASLATRRLFCGEVALVPTHQRLARVGHLASVGPFALRRSISRKSAFTSSSVRSGSQPKSIVTL